MTGMGRWPALGLALALGILATLSLLAGRIHTTVDLPFHLFVVDSFSQAVAQGTLLPRWFSASNQGLGDPSGLFTYPLFYLLAASLQTLGATPWDALRALALLAVAAATLAFILQTRDLLTARQQALGALLLALNPFQFWVLSLYNGPAWHLAFVGLAVFVTELLLRPKPRTWVLVVSVAVMTTSHILVTFMALLCAPLALWVARSGIGQQHRLRHLAQFALAVAAGLALVMFYLLPALTSRDLVRFDAFFKAGVLDWRNSFALPVLTSGWHGVYWFSVQWPLAAVTGMGLCVAGAIGFRARQSPAAVQARLLMGCALFGLTALALASDLAYLLYAHVDTFKTLQRPLRFLTCASVALAVAIPFGYWLQTQQRGPSVLRWMLHASTLAVLAVYLLIVLSVVRGAQPFVWDRKSLDAATGQPNALPVTAGAQWQQYVSAGGFAHECQRVAATCQRVADQPHLKSWAVQTSAAARLVLPVFAFPAWELKVNDKLSPSTIDAATGLVAVDLPAGRHSLQLQWQALASERVGLMVSLAALFATLVAALVVLVRRVVLPKKSGAK